MTSKDVLSSLHVSTRKNVSFNTFINGLRRSIALKYGYIMSAVDYDEMVISLVDLGILDKAILLQLEYGDDK